LLAEDNALLRQGLTRLIEGGDGLELAGIATDLPQLLSLVEHEKPDVVVSDIRMPPTGTDEGIQMAAQLRTEHPEIGVVLLSQHAEASYALALLEGGSSGRGYLLKERVFDVAILVDALRRIADGETVIDPTIVSRLFGRQRREDALAELTEREREVLGLIAEGLSNKAIAGRIFVTERTVEAHIKQIFLKLHLDTNPGSHRRVLAVLAYLRAGERAG